MVVCFAGIGGIDLGFERAGMQCVWQVENNPYANKVLQKHWPNVSRWDDIRTFAREPDARSLWATDVIAGGFPCQPVSTAGKRQAQKDPRWLWPEFFRVVCQIRPLYVVVENVPGLLNGPMGDVLGYLAKVGYDGEYEMLSAEAFGAPHLRERVFLVAYASGNGFEKQDRGGCDCKEQNSQENRGEIFNTSIRYGQNWTVRESVSNPSKQGLERSRERLSIGNFDWWKVEPSICRVANGVSNRVDKLQCLGNAVIPQVAEYVGQCVLEHWRSCGQPSHSEGVSHRIYSSGSART